MAQEAALNCSSPAWKAVASSLATLVGGIRSFIISLLEYCLSYRYIHIHVQGIFRRYIKKKCEEVEVEVDGPYY